MSRYKIHYKYFNVKSPNVKLLNSLTIDANSKSEAISKARARILSGSGFKFGNSRLSSIHADSLDDKKHYLKGRQPYSKISTLGDVIYICFLIIFLIWFFY